MFILKSYTLGYAVTVPLSTYRCTMGFMSLDILFGLYLFATYPRFAMRKDMILTFQQVQYDFVNFIDYFWHDGIIDGYAAHLRLNSFSG